MDRAHLRLFGWVATAAGVAALAAPNFPSLLNQALSDAFGTVLPAIPFAALLTVLFSLRWPDLRVLLLKEKGLASEAPARVLGLSIVASLLILRDVTGQSVESSGAAVILAAYGTSLALNPLTKRIMLPYAMIYMAGVTAPAILEWGFGEPLAGLSSALSAEMVSLSSVPITWQGTQFTLLSKTGELVTATVTPGCSSIISLTTFLGLLALMHIDLKKDLLSTATLAVVGVAALVILNSARIAILIWVGYASGASALWGVHNWVGYALFLGFYIATLCVYPRMGGHAAYEAPRIDEATHARLV